jgi:integrase
VDALLSAQRVSGEREDPGRGDRQRRVVGEPGGVQGIQPAADRAESPGGAELVDPRNLNRHWYSLRTRAGLPSVRFHDLRHTCVTLLLDAGVPPHIVQAIARHSGSQVTMPIYAHAAQEEQRKALRSLGERLA